VRRRRRLDEEIARFDALLHNLERQIESLRAKKQEVQNTVDERRARRLEEVREEALFDRLKHHFIGEVAGVEGVTHKHVVRLKKAGIRTAYEAKPERLERLRTVGDRTTARIIMWRAALIVEHEDALPEELSPAEERRIRRYVERRVSNLDAEIARARKKIQVQRTERQDVLARRDEVPSLSFGRYVLYLLRLDALPSRRSHEPARRSPARKASSPPARPDVPAPSIGDERSWWTSTGSTRH
jgi:DNA-binding helix-hairpin-helix protein with protein kinase domain